MDISLIAKLSNREVYGCKFNFPNAFLEKFRSTTENSLQLINDVNEYVPPGAAQFSTIAIDCNIILIADEDGRVLLYDTARNGNDAILAEWRAHSNAIFDVHWLPKQRFFLAGSGDQTIGLHDAERRELVQSFVGHTSSVKTLSLHPTDINMFVSGSRDGSIRLWDRRSCKKQKLRRSELYGLTCLAHLPACHQPSDELHCQSPSNNSYGTPTQSCSSPLILRRRSVVETTNSPLSGGCSPAGRKSRSSAIATPASQSITSVIFADENTIISSGSSDNRIKLWDVRRMTMRGQPCPKFVYQYPGTCRRKSGGYSNLLSNSIGSTLYAYCLDSVIYQYNLLSTSQIPVRLYTGHTASSFYLKISLSPDEGFLCCGSSDHHAYIYNVQNSKFDTPHTPHSARTPIVMLTGFDNEVTVPLWSPYDISKILTLSDDSYNVRLWSIYNTDDSKLFCSRILGQAETCSSSITLDHRYKGVMLLSPRKRELFTRVAMGDEGYKLGNITTVKESRQTNIEQFMKILPSRKRPFSDKNSGLILPRKLILSPTFANHTNQTTDESNNNNRKRCLDTINNNNNTTPVISNLLHCTATTISQSDESISYNHDIIKRRKLNSNIDDVKSLNQDESVTCASKRRRMSSLLLECNDLSSIKGNQTQSDLTPSTNTKCDNGSEIIADKENIKVSILSIKNNARVINSSNKKTSGHTENVIDLTCAMSGDNKKKRGFKSSLITTEEREDELLMSTPKRRRQSSRNSVTPGTPTISRSTKKVGNPEIVNAGNQQQQTTLRSITDYFKPLHNIPNSKE